MYNGIVFTSAHKELYFPGKREIGLDKNPSATQGRKKRISLFIADIVAMIFFSAVLCMGIEIFIAKMTPLQSLQARLAAIPVNLLTGRPYGCFRDRLFAFFSIDASRPVRAFFGDTLAFVIFQVPLYVIVLLTAGATWRQIALSTVFMSLIFSLAGRPYGIFLELCRKGADRLLGLPNE